jgi:hypothetical protein
MADPNELTGVLGPGEHIDIASAYVGGITAMLGSSAPFSGPGKYENDEGVIPWPGGVARAAPRKCSSPKSTSLARVKKLNGIW